MEQFIASHDKLVLQFSAGKDSAACLKLMEPWLYKTLVLWCNPGDPYRETLEYMNAVKARVPHFQMVMGTQRQFVKSFGYPADSVPFVGTPIGRSAHRSSVRVVPLQDCCGTNLWVPLHQATQASGATGVIRGERQDDGFRSSLNNLDFYAGQQYFCPLKDWSESDVVKFLGDDIPPSYKRGLKSSLDCRSCTAYLGHNRGRVKDLAVTEPDAFDEIHPVLAWLQRQAEDNLDNLHGAYE